MRKDFKTGLVIGVAVCITAALVFSFFPGAGFKSSIPAMPPDYEDNTGFVPPAVDRYESNGEIETVLPKEPVKPKVQTPDTKAEEKPAKPAVTIRYHTVKQGQTLSSIARQYYGDERQWEKIAAANRDVIENGYIIRPGMKLIIP